MTRDYLALSSDLMRFENVLCTDLMRFEAALRAEMGILRRDLTVRFGAMLAIATGVLLVAKFFG